ncbi:MAG TPA: hypothetical protein VNT55_04150, partial [Baekduia sp.]|nr:hypothetical protein [Baekduia sp.]
PQQRFRIPTPSSIDGANGSARFATLRNWVSAAERAGAAGGASSPWLVLVLHDVCDPPADPAAPCPGRHAIRADDLATLATYLKAEQAAGRLAVRTVTGALDAAYGTVTRERPLGLDAVPAPTAQARVVNGTMDADTPIGLAAVGDGRPDCFDVSDEQAPVTRARLRQADGTVGWVARLDVPRGESQRFTVRHDLGGCAVGVTAGRRYRLSVSYRVVSAGTDGAAPTAPLAPATSPLALFAWARNATAVIGAGAHHYGGRWFLAPPAAPWPVRTGWRTATCVTQPSPAARDALAPGLSINNADDAPGVAGLRDPATGTLSILVDDVAVTPSTAPETCLG